MATAIHRTTKELRSSVDLSELPGGQQEWLLNPDLSAVAGVEEKYWKIAGDQVLEMSAAEKAEVDAASLAAHRQARLEMLREAALRRLAETNADYQAAKAQVEAAGTPADVDAVTLPGGG